MQNKRNTLPLSLYKVCKNVCFPFIRVTQSSPGQVSLRFPILLSPQSPVSMTTSQDARFPRYPFLNTVISG